MVCVLNLGFYKDGKFNNDNWKIALKWLASNCNKIIIYTTNRTEDIGIDNIKCFHAEGEIINQTDYIKQTICFNDDKILMYLEGLHFSIDFGVSYMYFYYNDNCISELEVVDYENFLIFNLSDKQEKSLTSILNNLQENEHICYKHESDIKIIIGDVNWYPLGVHKI